MSATDRDALVVVSLKIPAELQRRFDEIAARRNLADKPRHPWNRTDIALEAMMAGLPLLPPPPAIPDNCR